MRILVVEDDRLLNNTLCYNLEAAGYVVDSALTKSAASDFLTRQDYDLIVLDVNLPDGNGFDFCREVKERRPDTAVIFLTANDMESDMLKGYELGAEDYVTKPFPMSVFQKKLSVVLARLAKQSGGGDSYEDGALSINFSEMTASLSGKALVFTPLEYRLLKILTKNPQNVLTRQVLLENEVPPQKQKEFLTAQASQLDKLDFLMQAMIKTSRLETGVISLEQKQQPVYDTLAAALGGILLNAEKKQIDVQVECPEHLDARHDRKWTSEALFNILDNAVKYTPAGGQIRVSVEGWEMYVKIDIADTGIGITEQHQGMIFKRFYREDAVHDVDGIGIGLYLAREIVTLQGGYIRVASEVGKGSTFSVFLLRK